MKAIKLFFIFVGTVSLGASVFSWNKTSTKGTMYKNDASYNMQHPYDSTYSKKAGYDTMQNQYPDYAGKYSDNMNENYPYSSATQDYAQQQGSYNKSYANETAPYSHYGNQNQTYGSQKSMNK